MWVCFGTSKYWNLSSYRLIPYFHVIHKRKILFLLGLRSPVVWLWQDATLERFYVDTMCKTTYGFLLPRCLRQGSIQYELTIKLVDLSSTVPKLGSNPWLLYSISLVGKTRYTKPYLYNTLVTTLLSNTVLNESETTIIKYNR